MTYEGRNKKGREITKKTFGTKAVGIGIFATRQGLYIEAWYDFDFVIEGGVLPWEEVEQMRRTVWEDK